MSPKQKVGSGHEAKTALKSGNGNGLAQDGNGTFGKVFLKQSLCRSW